MAESGVPFFRRNSDTDIKLYGYDIDLNGYRVRGAYSNPNSISKPLNPTEDDGSVIESFAGSTYHPGAQVEGWEANSGTQNTNDFWLAVNAVAKTSDTYAKFLFMPYLRVTAWNNTTKKATVCMMNSGSSTDIWRMKKHYFKGGKILLCNAKVGSNRVRSSTILTIEDNDHFELTFDSGVGDLFLPDDEYLLLTPMETAGTSTTNGIPYTNFKYIYSLKVNYIYPNPSPSYLEMENFSYSDGHCFSYTGHIGGNITSTTLSEIDFHSHVSPLATGFIGAMQAYTSASAASAYIYVSQSSGGNTIAHGGIDRASAVNDGGSCNFISPFTNTKQSIWSSVNSTNTTGLIYLFGYIED